MEEKVWLITGSSSGFGKELCKEILKNGDYCIATARKTEDLEDLKEISQDKLLTLSLDVTNQESINQAKEQAINWKNKINVLINNAGIGGLGALEEFSMENARKIFEVNVFGLMETTKAFLPKFREQKSGTIVNISSVVGNATMPGFSSYAGSKHAVEAISESLSEEVKHLGIKVIIVEPGAFRTSFGGHNMMIAESIEDYNPALNQMQGFMENFEQMAKGDPNKAAKAIIQVVNNNDNTLRFPVGNDSIDWMINSLENRIAQASQNEDLTRGTDFD